MASRRSTSTTDYDFGEDFQQHALAVLARIPGAVIRYRTALEPTYFTTRTLRQISEVLFAHVDEHRSIPQQSTLREAMWENVGEDDRTRVERVLRRIYRDDVTDAQAVLNRLIDFGQTQAYVNATLEAADKLERGDRNVRPLFDQAALVGEDLLDVGLDYRETIEERINLYRHPEQARAVIRTGIPHMDELLGGGLGRGEMGVILAPPKRGKTTTLVNIGYGALTSVDQLNVVQYSLEMQQDRINTRYDDRLMGERSKLRKTDFERYVEELRLRVARLARGRLFVKHYPTRTASVSKLRSHLSLLSARGFHPDLILVDYADIMKPERRLGEMRHEQAGIYEDLRTLAGDFNAALWTASQTSRGALEKEVITIDDFAEAFEKAAIVDAAFAFCQTDDERIDRKARLYAAALRNAEDGRTIEINVRRDICRIESVALFDVSGARMMIQGENPDSALDDTKTETRRAKQRRGDTADRVKRKAGMKRAPKRVAKKTRSRKPNDDAADKPKRRSNRPGKRVEV